ncbi:MAG: glycosyltransferase family 4 protein [Deltaproteobacteria bacterium]|nr:glycosyltransferase family 4 protein [Deltaproteobacteria bacterium]
MIHILLCPHALSFGGSQQSVHHWAKFLNLHKFKVSVLAEKKGGLSQKFESFYDVYYDAPGYPNIIEFIKKLNIDLIHACPGGGTSNAYIQVASQFVPITQTVMCPRAVANKEFVKKSIVLSRFVYDLQSDKTDVLHIDAPFDSEEYEYLYDRVYFGLPEDKIIVGSFGNPRKENRDFFKIASLTKDPRVHFVIKTNSKPIFKRGNITFINRFLTENEKMSLMKQLDIFLYPTSNESYGVVFLEAMSQKVPILTYEDSANPEVVGNGGLFSPLGDYKNLALLLSKLTADETLRKDLGQKGFKLFKARNDPQLIAQKYEKIFSLVTSPND